MEIKEVILIGTGNVAWHMAKAFTAAGIRIAQIAGRNADKGNEIARPAGCGFTNDLTAVAETDGIYFIAVNDTAIRAVADLIYKPGRRLVHCGGGVSSRVLEKDDNIYGVFYPVLSFNRNIEADISSAIICVDSNIELFTEGLLQLAGKLSRHTYHLDDRQRLILNMSAVWSNNFVNHLFTISEDILEKSGMHFNMLLPLIENSIEKIRQHSPSETQTGPAKRGEETVLQKHLELLHDNPEYASIYRLLSHSIKNKYLKS